jgi:hypothetical protein
MKKLAIFTAIAVVLFTHTGFAKEKKETGQGRRAQKMEEVRVYGQDLSKASAFRVGLTDIVLLHKYDEKKNEWVYIGSKNLSKKES